MPASPSKVECASTAVSLRHPRERHIDVLHAEGQRKRQRHPPELHLVERHLIEHHLVERHLRHFHSRGHHSSGRLVGTKVLVFSPLSIFFPPLHLEEHSLPQVFFSSSSLATFSTFLILPTHLHPTQPPTTSQRSPRSSCHSGSLTSLPSSYSLAFHTQLNHPSKAHGCKTFLSSLSLILSHPPLPHPLQACFHLRCGTQVSAIENLSDLSQLRTSRVLGDTQ